MIVAGPPGAMPFACSAGVRPGIFCTEETREPRWATEKTATAPGEAPQAIILLHQTGRTAGYGQTGLQPPAGRRPGTASTARVTVSFARGAARTPATALPCAEPWNENPALDPTGDPL